MIDAVYRIGKDYYPQVFFNECKYVVKEKKMSKFITDDIKVSSDDSDGENSDKKILMKNFFWENILIF